MRKFLPAALLAMAAAFAQTPAFEVASIKPAGEINPARIAAGTMKIGITIDAARVDIGFFSAADLIRTAYRLKSHELTGPDWMNGPRFNIQAKIPDGVSKDLVPEMLQSLLAERFKLTTHKESKELNVYALITGKNGHKFKEAPPDTPPGPGDPPASGQLKFEGNPQGGRGMNISSGGRGGVNMKMGENGQMRMEFEKLQMAEFAEMLARFVDRPVVDQTGLAGKYQVGLDLSMAEIRGMAQKAGAMMGQPSAAPAGVLPEGDGASSIFNSVQQLGLKLEARKLPVQVLVVDQLEKSPTEN